MSALRLSVPGKPVILVDLGPARAGGSGTHYVSLSEAVPAITGRTTFTQKPSEAKPKPRYGARIFDRPPEPKVRCGYIMPILGVPCARGPHSSRDHRSAETVAASAERRRRP